MKDRLIENDKMTEAAAQAEVKRSANLIFTQKLADSNPIRQEKKKERSAKRKRGMPE